LALQKFRTALIGLLLKLITMPTPIKLDHESRIEAEEIRDIGANRVLSPEFHPVNLTAPQALPQPAFDASLCDTQPSRSIAGQHW